jgi:hypothetical protein
MDHDHRHRPRLISRIHHGELITAGRIIPPTSPRPSGRGGRGLGCIGGGRTRTMGNPMKTPPTQVTQTGAESPSLRYNGTAVGGESPSALPRTGLRSRKDVVCSLDEAELRLLRHYAEELVRQAPHEGSEQGHDLVHDAIVGFLEGRIGFTPPIRSPVGFFRRTVYNLYRNRRRVGARAVRIRPAWISPPPPDRQGSPMIPWTRYTFGWSSVGS